MLSLIWELQYKYQWKKEEEIIERITSAIRVSLTNKGLIRKRKVNKKKKMTYKRLS